jgi:flagellar basal-body rod modification protein FlgD
MAIGDTTGPGAAGQANSADKKPAAAAPNQAMGRDAFMQLLVAQLKNQDPLNPVDTENFVTQLSQLTSVEKLVEMSDQIGALKTATDGMAANQSAGLIGKKVEATNDSGQLGPTGGIKSAVNLGAGASKVTVNVVNEAGRVVRSFDPTSFAAGKLSEFEWDGKTNTGERAAAGTYTFEVDAKDGKGNPVESSMMVSGIVSGVSYEHGYPELVLGTTRVRLSSVKSIGQ